MTQFPPANYIATESAVDGILVYKPRPAEADRPAEAVVDFKCPNCDGRLKPIALIEDKAVIEKILTHLKLPTEEPQPSPARAPPQAEFEFAQDEPVFQYD